MTERKSLQQLAAEANQGGGGIECPGCGCKDFRTYGTIPGKEATFRYKSCRHCGRKILTTTVQKERIIRDVNESDSETGIVLRLA